MNIEDTYLTRMAQECLVKDQNLSATGQAFRNLSDEDFMKYLDAEARASSEKKND